MPLPVLKVGFSVNADILVENLYEDSLIAKMGLTRSLLTNRYCLASEILMPDTLKL